jgi:hypothetical protein
MTEERRIKLERRYDEMQEWILEGNRAIGDYLGWRYSSDKDGNGRMYRNPNGGIETAATLKFHLDWEQLAHALEHIRSKGHSVSVSSKGRRSHCAIDKYEAFYDDGSDLIVTVFNALSDFCKAQVEVVSTDN